MTPEFWEQLVGSTVCGYDLRQLTGHTDQSAVYLTSYQEDSAALKLAPIDKLAPPVPKLANDHILRLYASGTCEAGGSSFRYFVSEVADENLGAVIASRPLSPDEAQAMLEPVLQALEYLHGRGLAHGSLKPSNILAHGDSVKLSVDSIRPAGAAVSREEDMTALGLTLIEVLTQRREPSAIANVPQPFRDIVEHTLEPDPASRWSAPQAAMRLSGAMPEAPAQAALSVPAPEPKDPKKVIPRWVLPAAVAVMIGAVVFVLARGTGSSSDSSLAAGNPPPVVQKPVVQAPAARKPMVQNPVQPASRPVPPKPTPFDPAPKPAPAAVQRPEGHGWFVVVASYVREADAAQEVSKLSHSFPDFKPRVFPPSPIDTHYLVIIGSGLTEENAESLRQRAVSTGLPPDTYIKRYPKPI